MQTEDKVPLTANFEQELSGITKSALEDLKKDSTLASSSSISGQYILQIAATLLLQLPMLCEFLLPHLDATFASSAESSDFLKSTHRLRLNATFVNGFVDFILRNLTLQIPNKFLNRFVQHFITAFTKSFFTRKAELVDSQREIQPEALSDNDNHVIFYICGYIIHALRKRYYRIKNQSKRQKLLMSLDSLKSMDEEDLPVSKWMEDMNRGGLKKPSDKFYKIMVQVERWLRESVHKDNLHQDSLVLLQAKLMDYQLLITCWDRIVTCTSEESKLLLLEHVLALFLKVRGFALVRLVRKDLCRKRKQSKVAAGTKKALRRELKEMNKTN